MRVNDQYTFDDLAQLPEDAAPAAPAPAAPASSWDKIQAALKTAIPVVSEAWKKVRSSKKASRSTEPAYQPTPQYYNPPTPAPQGLQTKDVVLIAGGGLALIAVIYFLTRS